MVELLCLSYQQLFIRTVAKKAVLRYIVDVVEILDGPVAQWPPAQRASGPEGRAVAS